MNKLLIGIVVLGFVSLSAYAQQAERKMSEKALRATGGRVERPGTQKGEVVYVNCQKAASDGWLRNSADCFRKETRFNVTVKEGAFDFKAPHVMGNASIFVVDDLSFPTILAAPEDRWVVVNVAKLKSEKVSVFEARVMKELTRGFALLCGASNSTFPDALTGAVRGVDDLDRHVGSRLPVDVLQRFAGYMKPFGVEPMVLATYRTACQQGWASAPTNEYQKVIWEKVKAEADIKPSNPMKITKEKK